MSSRLWKLPVVLACATAAVLAAVPARAQGTPLRVSQAPQGFCDPCRPAPTITGATAWAAVRLVRELRTAEGWQPVSEEIIGQADGEGRLTVPVPARPGVYRSYVMSSKRISNAVYFEVRNECAPPIQCGPGPEPGPIGPMRVSLGLFELRPREPQTILIERARPNAPLFLVRQRFNGTEWETVLERDLGTADRDGRLLDIEPAEDAGLFRDVIGDRDTGLSSDAALYEVRPLP